MPKRKPLRPPRRLAAGFFSVERRVFAQDMRGDADLLLIWLALLAYANPVDGTERLAGQQVIVKRGQLVCGLEEIADEFDIGMHVVRRCLSYLEKTGRIVMQTGNQGRLITIVKYDDYQRRRKEPASEPANDRQTTRKRPAKDTQHPNRGTGEQGNRGTLGGSGSASRTGRAGKAGLSATSEATAVVGRAAAEAIRQHETGKPWDEAAARDALGAAGLALIKAKWSRWGLFAGQYVRKFQAGHAAHFEGDAIAYVLAEIKTREAAATAGGNGPPEPVDPPPPSDADDPGDAAYQNGDSHIVLESHRNGGDP